jgi:hypothetical protein
MALSKPQASEVWGRLASGIEAGVVGGVAMLGLLVSESLWDGHVWWEVPNLFGSTFYGPRAFRAGPGMATLSGFALHFVITGTVGGLFGLAFGGIRQRGRLILLGLLAAVGWYNLAYSTFWPAVNPWVLLGSPRPATMVSHVLLGACLGYMGQRQRLTPPLEVPNLTMPAGYPAPPSYVAHPAEIALSQVALPQEASPVNGQPPSEDSALAAGRIEPSAANSPDALE